MDNNILKYNINPLVSAIGKMPEEFTKEDIINFITANDIRVVNFRYIAGDGRLKTLNFPVSSLQYLDLILSFGERVDGSSLFSYIEAGSSDLYVIPRFSTAYPRGVQEDHRLHLRGHGRAGVLRHLRR